MLLMRDQSQTVSHIGTAAMTDQSVGNTNPTTKRRNCLGASERTQWTVIVASEWQAHELIRLSLPLLGRTASLSSNTKGET